MGKHVGNITEGNVILSVFDNDANVKGEKVLIRNIKVERRYMENGQWKSNNYFSENALQNLRLAICRYNDNDYDKKKDDNNAKS